MNRHDRRSFAALSRQRKWHLLAGRFGTEVALAAMDHVNGLKRPQRRALGLSVFGLRHEEHRRGNVLLRLYA